MTTIKQTLTEDMKKAMRNKDKVTLTTIRLIIDRIQKKEKDLLRELSQEEVVQVIQTFKKQVQEEADAFDSAGKLSRVAELIDVIFFIEKYLPEQLTKDEIYLTVHLTIAGMQRDGVTINKGTVMKEVIKQTKGLADNKIVSQIVSEIIG